MFNIAICDDEESWCQIIQTKLTSCINLNFTFEYSVSCFSSLNDLKKSIEQKQVDFAFVDISMYDENSIDWAIENLQNFDTPIIFTTVYPQTAGNLYDCKNCCYYIIKTRLDQKLKTAIEAAIKKINENGSSFISFKGKDERFRIKASDILYVDTSANRNQIVIHKSNGDSLHLTLTIKECFKLLPDFFLRCHNSCIVNCRHIRTYEHTCDKTSSGTVTENRIFVLDSGNKVPITFRKYNEIVREYHRIINSSGAVYADNN